MPAIADGAVASINGIALNAPGDVLSPAELRQRACTELLRQAAQRAGLLAADDAPSADGVISEAAARAIEALLEQSLECSGSLGGRLPQALRGAMKRPIGPASAFGYGTFSSRSRRAWTSSRCANARRRHCSTCAATTARPAIALPPRARESSNCPSGAEGGELGMLVAADCAPEFARELFGRAEVGVLPRLVHSRFGLHVVEVLEREPGVAQSFDTVRGAVAMSLRQLSYVTALRQYLRLLAGEASIEGIDLDAADTPLVQ